jgi:hypothetical protein
MLKNIVVTCVAVAGMCAAGCGGGDDTTSLPTEDMAMTVFKVQSGSYAVSNLTKVNDACMIDLAGSGFTSIMVTNDGMGNLKLGSLRGPTDNPPAFNPAGYTNGEGTFTDSYHATTTLTTMVKADTSGSCTYNLTRTNMVTVTANNKLHVEFKEDESNISAGCGFTGTTCTSQYTYDAGM